MVRYTSRVNRTVKPRRVKKGVASGGAAASGGAVPSGGAIPSGGALRSGGVIDPDTMNYPEMIHALGSMNNEDFHLLQGLASTMLPQVVHPLKMPLRRILGGSFVHPGSISKVATKDIVSADTPMRLAAMLHGEFLDQQDGKDVGGGLFSSLKNAAKRGIKGLSRGARGAVNIGKRVNSFLKRGRAVAKTFQAPLSRISPAAAEALERGLGVAERVEAGLGRGLELADPVTGALEELSSSVNPMEDV